MIDKVQMDVIEICAAHHSSLVTASVVDFSSI
jgi:hypothetical protein